MRLARQRAMRGGAARLALQRPRGGAAARERGRQRPARLMWKLSSDMAERNGALLRRRLAAAERLSELATARGERCAKTPRSRSSALLVRMTCDDQRLPRFAIPGAVQCLCL